MWDTGGWGFKKYTGYYITPVWYVVKSRKKTILRNYKKEFSSRETRENANKKELQESCVRNATKCNTKNIF